MLMSCVIGSVLLIVVHTNKKRFKNQKTKYKHCVCIFDAISVHRMRLIVFIYLFIYNMKIAYRPIHGMARNKSKTSLVKNWVQRDNDEETKTAITQ